MILISIFRVATSKPFTFLIGPLQTEYTIHSALVAHQSPALAAMVNGKFQESRECCVKWDDLEEIVFKSFWQFVYTGDYDTPEPLPSAQRNSGLGNHESDRADEPAETEPEPEPEPEQPEVDPEQESGSGSQATDMSGPYLNSVPRTTRPLLRLEKQLRVRTLLQWAKFFRLWEVPYKAIDVDILLKDQANHLVHHAKVFTLADRYGVKRLAELSQRKLVNDLNDLVTKGKDYTNMVELVRYTFEDLVPDQLRDMVIDFSGCVIEKLWGLKEFDELLEKHGILSKALIGKLLYRLGEP
ncbi:unnamed protein product [Fusarium fujikuroi]|uniref:BTB domain-containing protein n=1 Tax=Fusarium fujikuroi TaxID=5127 RepID=A0A9Q9UGY9_FUSFU|nr:unnamed protein product [Fusarium fujikuroi]